MRNLFTDIQENRIPATVMSNLLPQVVKDMNYVTGLTENLLLWAKSQMQTASINPQLLDLSALIDETVKQQRLQAELKGIKISGDVSESLFVIADRDMINLVLRNLLSNAIKFSPHNSGITVGASVMDSSVEVFVADSGAGISPEALEKIKSHNYYSTKGTANESGTGLGLMLVKEFLEKNNGQLHIESRPGRGSIFSFTLPKAEI
jgi:signal transduction histidine kinase